MLVCVLEGPLSDCTCVFYFFIRRAGRSCLVGGLGAALKKQGGLNQSIWSLKCLLDDSYVEGLFSSIPPLLISKWRLSVETCGIWWGFLRSLQYLSKMILSGKVHQVLVWLWDAVSVPEFCFKVASVTCCGCRNQLQEPGDLLTERKFMMKSYSDPLYPSVWASGYSSLWSRKDQRCPGVAQRYLLHGAG